MVICPIVLSALAPCQWRSPAFDMDDVADIDLALLVFGRYHRTASNGASHRATAPGTRHYRQVSQPPRLPDVHTWREAAVEAVAQPRT
jgi:hypothetical protein